ncbi:MAG: MoaD/ThiS family protein [Candidatus Hodarchaeales archaeon]
MRVNVQLFASLRKYHIPHINTKKKFLIQLVEGSEITHLLKRLEIPEDQAKVIMLNGKLVEKNVKIHEEDEILIFPPVGGCKSQIDEC